MDLKPRTKRLVYTDHPRTILTAENELGCVNPHPETHNGETEKPEVIIIGNGPSGICLSYLLSGHWPFYTGFHEDVAPHLDETLLTRLAHIDPELSLMEQELGGLANGLEGRSPNQMALLFDALSNPGADLGARLPSLLRWDFSARRKVPHVVLGRKDTGGVWQSLDEQNPEGRVKTLSLGSWMELPGMSLQKWIDERNSNRRTGEFDNFSRANMADISSYYREYAKRQGLTPHFRSYTTVTCLHRIVSGPRSLDCENGELEEEEPDSLPVQHATLWEVCGYRTTHNELGERIREEFRYAAPNVVMATGIFDKPLHLGVPGETLPYVVHSFHELEKRLERTFSTASDPVVIIGGGLTAADAILALRDRKIPTVHVHRRTNKAGVYLQQLPPRVYPEYHDVFRLMNAEHTPEWYTGYSEVDVVEFTKDRDVVVACRGSGCETTIRASFVAVLVGSSPDLSYVCPSVLNSLGVKHNARIDGRNNLVDVDPVSYESVNHPGLYAMGPLVGDQMVRFIRGGALAIASHVWSKRHRIVDDTDPNQSVPCDTNTNSNVHP